MAWSGARVTADCYVVGIDLIVYQESQLPPSLAWPDLLSLSTAAVVCTVQYSTVQCTVATITRAVSRPVS